jgi:uncharacterized protein (TIGR02452 family)
LLKALELLLVAGMDPEAAPSTDLGSPQAANVSRTRAASGAAGEDRGHRFRFNAKLGNDLTSRAPAFKRNYGLNGRLVPENDRLVKAGVFTARQGGREIQLELPKPPPSERLQCPQGRLIKKPQFDVTDVCIANIDTLSAALMAEDATALNFANAYNPGGGYRRGASAQEEDLCRLLPQLIHSLEACRYPIRPDEVLLTKNLAAIREPGTYQLCESLGPVHILTSAMPCGDAGEPGCKEWNSTVTLRMRAVLHAARESGFPNLVLGAWGCGAFGNPPDLVAQLFREQLCSPEFRGAFSIVVFAVIDPAGDGNFRPFEKEIRKMDETTPRSGKTEADSGKQTGNKGYPVSTKCDVA